MRRIRDIGEFGLIELISGWIGEGQGPRVVLGTGDDGAVLRPAKGHDIVVSTDSLVEDVHFRWRTQSARFVGRRAVVANLSDLAAMGAVPMGCVAALCVPPDLELRLVKGVVQGMVQEARAHGCPLVGGNLTSARETSITITVLGSVARGRDLRRHRVRVADRVYVTGCLGGASLAVARAERREVAIRSLPVPRLAAGRALARLAGVGGCIDVSDGLLADLAHLLEGSGLGAHIEVGQIPRPRGFEKACRDLGLDPNRLCLAGGEDYELLFTLRPQAAGRNPTAALSRRLGVPVSELGRITRAPGISGVPDCGGWRHF